MSLKSLNLKRAYKSIDGSVIESFYIPALKESILYERAVGYFTIGALINLTEGIIDLIKRNGEIHIIASPHLLESDLHFFQHAISLDEEFISHKLSSQIYKVLETNSKLKLDLIAHLISAKILKIKIAYKSNGLYHEKLGLMTDFEGNYIAMEGSNNETTSAQLTNYESFKVFPSWVEGISEYAKDTRIHFSKLWNSEIHSLTVIDLPLAIEQKIISTYKTSENLESSINNIENINDNEVLNNKDTHIVNRKELYPYQQTAINEFIQNEYRHFFEMATGTGKTFTSIKAIKKLIEEFKRVFVIILVPQIDLQTQWYEELKNQDITDIQLLGGIESSNNWRDNFNKNILNYNLKMNSVFYISTYDSFFTKLISEINHLDNLAIVIDEAHNLSRNQIQKLPSHAKFRLGLSATPEKHSKEETNKIIQYFIGKEKQTYKYTIEQAISNNFLSHYTYEPIFLRLTTEEYELYTILSKKIAAAISSDNKQDDVVNRLLNERSLIVKKATNKIVKLNELLLDNNYDFRNSVIYCGQGKDLETEEKIIDKVTSSIYKHRGLSISTFTSNTENRKEVLRKFESGFYDTLVAIKCFDEGVDVPKLDKIYIMASDRLLRQTIQRRGRVLRKCKESGKDSAFIFDFVVLPPEDTLGKNLVKNELIRVKEYARLATNKDTLDRKIYALEQEYQIAKEDYHDYPEE